MRSKGLLYMVPGLLGQGDPRHILGEETLQVIRNIRYFVVENQKNAVRFLVACGMKEQLAEIEFGILNEHTRSDEYSFLLEPVLQGQTAGILSDAGCPGIADPGADLVALAHQHGIEVRPLTGPTSIVLALMGSGLNGQSFAFHGYLPVKPPARIQKIRELEKRSAQQQETQICIEAPYRNRQLLHDLLSVLAPSTRLCLAAGLTQPDQILLTRTVSVWKKAVPDLHKIPAVFLFQA